MSKKTQKSNRGVRRSKKAAERKSKKAADRPPGKHKRAVAVPKKSRPEISGAADLERIVAEGMALQGQGAVLEAKVIYERAILINPGNPDLLFLLALAELDLKNLQEAEEILRRCIRIEPDRARYHKLLGKCLKDQGRHKEALEHCQKIAIEEPDSYDYHIGVATSLFNLRRFDEAVPHLERAIEIAPTEIDPYTNLSILYRRSKQLPEALEMAQKGVDLAPDDARSMGELGAVFSAMCKYREAEEVLKKALALSTTDSDVYSYMGEALRGQGQFLEAYHAFEKASQLKPGSRTPLSNLATLLLAMGKIEDGWRGYDIRLDRMVSSTNPWVPEIPIWDGETDISDKSILVCMEQGIGDESMFASILPDLVKVAGKVLSTTERRLFPVLSRSFPEIEFVERMLVPTREYVDELKEKVDCQVASGTLARLFRKTVNVFPRHDGYLKADPNRVAQFKERYDALFPGKKRVGFSWFSGSMDFGKVRSVPLGQWEGILSHETCAFINLQYGDAAKEIQEFEKTFKAPVFTDTEVDSMKDMESFYAQVKSLDLVITIDNSTAHVAGALDVPVWTILPINHDWRWFGDVDWSPWYPSMRLYRQKEYKDWTNVLSRVSDDLATWGQEKRIDSP